ncbi:MAG TPA: hypothetical protein VEC93_12265, partial [Anaerolineae bacterium]|nr:hypothetical protein [Anaerolineae bacterium]
ARPIYLPLARFNDPPLLFYLSETFERQAALSAPPADSALVISPEKNGTDAVWVRLQGDTATILPPLTAEGQQLIQTALISDVTQAIQTPRGEIVAHLASLPTDPAQFVQQPTQTLTATFGSARLVGATYPLAIEPTFGELPVTLYWQASRRMVDDYEVILQLVDDKRQVWGDGTARPNDWAYPTTFWQPGLETIATQQKIIFEAATLRPGRYWLAVALFNPATGQRLPLTEGRGDSPDTFFSGPLKVPLPPPAPLPSLAGGSITFGDVARLAGFANAGRPISAGEPVRFTLLWEVLTTPTVDYTVFVHLLDANDTIVASHDTQPLNNTYPTTIWSPGERILDEHILPTPASLPAGQYRLAVGLYHQPTGERLPLHFPDGRKDTEGRLILTSPITIITP